MRRLSGFSLMEMMTTLLIISIIAAAAAPMINKKMMAESAGSGRCNWLDVNDGIAYNTNANPNQTVIIGAQNLNRNNAAAPKLHIRTNNNNPFITFERNNLDNPLALRYRENTVGLSNLNLEIGDGATAVGIIAGADSGSTVIGNGAGAVANGTALGRSAIANERCIAIGGGSIAAASDSIAIGTQSGNNITQALGINSISIGSNATASSDNSIALGNSAITNDVRSVAIGHTASSVELGTAIGPQANVSGLAGIAIGEDSQAAGESSIAIGSRSNSHGTIASGAASIAIGDGAVATQYRSVAIGAGAEATQYRSVAIGDGASANGPNQIVLGTSSDTVYIPGNLIVGGNTFLGVRPGGYQTYIKTQDYNGGDWALAYVRRTDGGNEVSQLEVDTRVKWLKDKNGNKISGYFGDAYHTPDLLEWILSSDRRLKNVGKAFTGGLAELKKLDLFHFTYKKDEAKTPRVGIMAQDLQKVFPDAVTKGDDGFLRIRMEDMFYALINAVKELAGIFDKQDERIVQLEKENKQLQKTVSDLEKRLAKLERGK